MESPLIWAQIDLDAIAANVHALKQLIPESTRFMAVVKADAYGHGSVAVAQKALAAGAHCLGVARLHEAETLRNAGIEAPILIFGYTWPEQARLLSGLDLAVTVYTPDMAARLSREASRAGVCVRAHLKVDTGMGRVGLLPDSRRVAGPSRGSALDEVRTILELPGLDVEGIYTHFAAADSPDKDFFNYQLRIFEKFLDDLANCGMTFRIRHAANSAGIIYHPDSHFDMVRAGISLYGLYPSPEVDRSRVVLVPAMTLKSVITSVKSVPQGFPVSYGMTWRAPRETRIASVPVGYADGFSRSHSSRGSMLVRGVAAPIAGRVCMDQTLIDVGHIPDAEPGDEVVIIGSQGAAVISADDLALQSGTINYEVVSALTARVSRIYPKP
ncbi:MAG: alanine racemase [Pseudomonadota bacterium]